MIPSRTSKSLVGLFFALFALAMPHLFTGQAVNGTLLGTVTDQTGAAIANASVKATETATAAIHDSVTNESGNYTFPNLQPGTYTVTAEAAGFKKLTQTAIDLQSNSSTRVDLKLETGSVSEKWL
jgi:protocatechuate 3,4-dioxygenase beta subunit